MNLTPSLSVTEASILQQDQLYLDNSRSQLESVFSIAIGIVLFNNPLEELADLARTLHRAVARLAESEARAAPQQAILCAIWLQNNGDSPVDLTIFGPHARLTDSTVNVGFGRAHNFLMRGAFADGAQYYLALNPDGMLHPDALVELIAVMRRSEGRALVEASQIPEESARIFDPVTLDTPWASGCCLLIPHAIYAATGGFDENMFLYCEDVDLSWRARNAGYMVKHSPAALFCHAWHRAGVMEDDVDQITPTSEEVLIDGIWHKRVHLDSARYLGAKWGDEAFLRKVECDMTAKGWEPRLLPKFIPRQHDLSVADFSRELGFAHRRWIYPDPIPNHTVTLHADIDNTIDVIVRFHDPNQIPRLSKCLFSLYGQQHRNIQVILMLQGLDDTGVVAVNACVDAFDWLPPRWRPIVINVALPPTGDHGAQLWNAGLEVGRSRYLGFCDFDDIVYSAGYSYLLHRLQFTGAAVVFASSMQVDYTPMRGFDFVFAKRVMSGKDNEDFFPQNFTPPNSVLFDRSKVELQDLRADATLSKSDDYGVFAAIVSKYKFDGASVETIVSESWREVTGS
jgi:hypothetical protein